MRGGRIAPAAVGRDSSLAPQYVDRGRGLLRSVEGPAEGHTVAAGASDPWPRGCPLPVGGAGSRTPRSCLGPDGLELGGYLVRAGAGAARAAAVLAGHASCRGEHVAGSSTRCLAGTRPASVHDHLRRGSRRVTRPGSRSSGYLPVETPEEPKRAAFSFFA